MTVIDRARRYIDKMPSAVAGAGGHSATFAVACTLVHGFALAAGDALRLLSEWNGTHADPPWSDADLRHKIDHALAKSPPDGKASGYLIGDAAGAPQDKASHHSLPPKPRRHDWPERDYDAIRHIVSGGHLLADLWDLSPASLDGLDSEAVADHLFPGDPWLCIARDQRKARTARRTTFGGTLAGMQFIVPNPMTGPQGKTQSGRLSARSLDNTGPRRFLVIEFDFESERNGKPTPDRPLLDYLTADGVTIRDLCAALLIHLAQFAPLCLVVNSGGKSLHGWFTCADRSEADLRRFMRYAVHLGADRATWCRCQFVRMPGGIRDNGQYQSILFFAPDLA